MHPNVKDNVAKNCFEMEVAGQVVFCNYMRVGNVVRLTHVETPLELRGKGAADMLMQGIMETALAENFKVFPICSYAVSWLNKHNEYNDLLG